jgi:hypothetical protein
MQAQNPDNIPAQIAIYDALGELYQAHLVDQEMAAQAYEEAHLLDPENKSRLEKLAAIYDADPEGFKEKGIQLQEALLAQNPYRQESYKALRKVYTVARDADASWALCQALSVLKLAEPDEERFYDRMRAETAAPAQQAFTDDDWFQYVAHPTLDPLLTSIFALIEPAVVKARSQSLTQTGLSDEMRIDPGSHDAPLAQTLYYAAGVLGVELPDVLANPNDAGGLSYLHTETPTLAMGQVALSPEVPPQVAAFVAARQLAFTRRGLYLRQFVQTGTALKAWLFAAIKLSSPAFPVASDLEGSVNDALTALKTHLTSDAKDHLASTVSRLIQSGSSLDLKKWFAAVDLTADRAGLIVAHDLATATEVAKATQEQGASVDGDDRFRELVIFATSHSYLQMRRQLGVTVEG